MLQMKWQFYRGAWSSRVVEYDRHFYEEVLADALAGGWKILVNVKDQVLIVQHLRTPADLMFLVKKT